jgi:hypothetical protein
MHLIVLLCTALLATSGLSVSSAQKGGAVTGSATGTRVEETGIQPPAADPAVKARLDYDQNLKDAARLVQLAAEIKQELESANQLTLSAATVRKSEELEKLSKKLHDRMKGVNSSAPKVTSAPTAVKPGR